MAAVGEKIDKVLWLHIKLLYVLLTILTAGSVCAIFKCFIEIHNLRQDLDATLLSNRAVEFANLEDILAERKLKYQADFDSENDSTEANDGKAESETPDFEGNIENNEDQLIRVRKKRHASFYRTADSRRHGRDAATPGSGSNGPDDWVWLSSYSRIPVSQTNQY